MPLLDGNVLAQALIAFAAIGLLGLVLRWTFSHDVRHPAPPGEATDTALADPNLTDTDAGPTDTGVTDTGPKDTGPTDKTRTEIARTDTTRTDTTPADTTPAETTPGQLVSTSEDFGLLATVAMFDTREDAIRVRALLADAGIRATTSVSADNRYRVLVFSSELDRARRVGGGSA